MELEFSVARVSCDCKTSWAGIGSGGGDRRLFLLGHCGRSSHSSENLKEQGWCGVRGLCVSLDIVGSSALLSLWLSKSEALSTGSCSVSSELLRGGVTSPGLGLLGLLNIVLRMFHLFFAGCGSEVPPLERRPLIEP